MFLIPYPISELEPCVPIILIIILFDGGCCIGIIRVLMEHYEHISNKKIEIVPDRFGVIEIHIILVLIGYL